MSDKDFEELVFLLERLEKLIAKHDELQEGDKPFLIPADVYDEICDRIKQSSITLFGVS